MIVIYVNCTFAIPVKGPKNTMDKFSYLSNGDVVAIEELYNNYKNDPQSVDFGWQKFFEGFDFSKSDFESVGSGKPSGDAIHIEKEFKVINLITGYRSRGHLFTKTNPVRERRTYKPTLDHKNFGLEDADLEVEFDAGKVVGIGKAKLKDIITHLKNVYCQSIGFEFMYIRDPEEVDWFIRKIDVLKDRLNFSKKEKELTYRRLARAVNFEKFLHKKFVGQKRFSLEGGEALIPAMHTAVDRGAELGVEEFFVGMAHRGRLNVLANVFKKPFSDIFTEFEGYEYEQEEFDGDVKYHLGYNSKVRAENEKLVEMHLLPNPSHLEAVDPVVQGIARSVLEHKYNLDYNKVAPILIHGDAAIAAQGIVYEVAQMSQLEGYKTGGTIHIVINNQVGFTTNYLEARSSTYCTDIAKVIKSPVFHVNGDDVEAMVFAMKLAVEYRQKYNKDVFIDLLCYRKHGHNEGDEPRFTQPKLYKIIDKHPSPKDIYAQKILSEGSLDKSYLEKVESEYNTILERDFEIAKQRNINNIKPFYAQNWEKYKQVGEKEMFAQVDTKVSIEKLKSLANQINNLPHGLNFNKKAKKIFAERQKMIEENRLDWALGETLAYASLLTEGYHVRISGQDSVRGTFSHRHAILRMEDSEEEYTPLDHIDEKSGVFSIYNSPLSEYGVLGFEYGYAMGLPESLTIWEAQFGDFCNGAQIIIDQFLSSAEDKWNSQNGLVLYLPHGYEGQGAEHSSARLERFLALCAEANMQVVNCTTPANLYHLLRRQMLRTFRKPLVLMTPKSLLRHPQCVSTLEDLANGSFQEVIDDPEVNDASAITKLMLCSGKVYYELVAERAKLQVDSVAIVRLEQLYPFPEERVLEIIGKYSNAFIIWVQEEPENMGSWMYILKEFRRPNLRKYNIEVAAQAASASPAAGSPKLAANRYARLLKKAFENVPVN